MRDFLNIILVGPMGAGKTSLGRALAKAINWEFYDTDQIIEQKSGAELLWIHELEGEKGFRNREQKVVKEFVQRKNIVLATGGGTVATAENRLEIKKNSFVIYLYASLFDQLVRTGYGSKRPLAKDTEKRRRGLKKFYKEHVEYYENLADIVYNTGKKREKNAVDEMVALIRDKTDILCMK